MMGFGFINLRRRFIEKSSNLSIPQNSSFVLLWRAGFNAKLRPSREPRKNKGFSRTRKLPRSFLWNCEQFYWRRKILRILLFRKALLCVNAEQSSAEWKNYL